MWVLMHLGSFPSHEGNAFSFVTFAVGQKGSYPERVYYIFSPAQADQVVEELLGRMEVEEYQSLQRALDNFKTFPGFSKMQLQCYTGEEARMQYFMSRVALRAIQMSSDDEEEKSGGQQKSLRN